MNTEALRFLTEKDEKLKSIIESVSLPTFKSTKNVFHDLMSCVLEQQIHYRSTKKTFQKMLQTACLDILTPDNFSQFEEKSFFATNLSVSKYETILRILAFWRENKIDWSVLNEEEVIEKLSSIKGIGSWTIHMILLYTLEKPDIFPFNDYHVKQIMVQLYGLDPNVKLKSRMLEIANKWTPYKSLAVRYLLAWKESNKNALKY